MPWSRVACKLKTHCFGFYFFAGQGQLGVFLQNKQSLAILICHKNRFLTQLDHTVALPLLVGKLPWEFTSSHLHRHCLIK